MPGRRDEFAAISPSAVAYCRAARRLRGRLASRPARLHRALRELQVDQRGGAPAAGPARRRGGCAGGFAAEVARRMDGPVLRHAQRRALLAIAARLGIARFEANLIIAAVQHERRTEPGRRPATSAPAAASGILRVAPAVLGVALQALIVWGAWRVWCG